MNSLAAFSILLIAGGEPLQQDIEMAAATAAYCSGMWRGLEEASTKGLNIEADVNFRREHERAAKEALRYRNSVAPGDKELSKAHLRLTTRALVDTLKTISDEDLAMKPDAAEIAKKVVELQKPDCIKAVKLLEGTK